MSDQDSSLPEALRKTLKDSAPYQPPESFYTDILRTIRTRPERRPRWAWLLATPVKLATLAAVVMVSYFAVHDQIVPESQKTALMNVTPNPVQRIRRKVRLPYSLREAAPVVYVSKKESVDATVGSRAKASLDYLSPRDESTLKDTARPDEEEPVLSQNAGTRGLNKNVSGGPTLQERANQTTFPWQSRLQAKGMAENAPTGDDAALAATGAAMGSAYTPTANASVPGTWTGDTSAIRYFRTVVITTAPDWRVLWNEHRPGDTAPVLDFNDSMVVGIFAGNRTDLKAIELSAVISEANTIRVLYREVISAAGAPSLANQSYTLRVIPKSSASVKFEKVP